MIQGRAFHAVVEHLRLLSGEASERTQIGRCYFAAFLEARAYCVEHLGYTPRRSASEHQHVSRLLATHHPEIASRMRMLRKLRNHADYDVHLSPATIRGQAGTAWSHGSAIVARLDELAAARQAADEPS